MDNIEVKVYKNENFRGIKLPKYMTEHSSGMDIYAAEDKLIPKGKVELIKTGLHVEVPKGYEIQIRPRSGLALKKGITILNSPGTIDSDYRGEIGIILANLGSKDFKVKKGLRIAQMVLSKVYKISWKEVDDLNKTKRNEGGFGHTGV
jgi:dUTP pyrophosphatase